MRIQQMDNKQTDMRCTNIQMLICLRRHHGRETEKKVEWWGGGQRNIEKKERGATREDG